VHRRLQFADSQFAAIGYLLKPRCALSPISRAEKRRPVLAPLSRVGSL